MNKEEFKKEFDAIITESKEVLIVTHIGPDEDAICSSLAMKSYIDDNFKTNTKISITGKRKRYFDYLIGYEQIDFVEDIAEVVNLYDTIIFLDSNVMDRFSKISETEFDFSNQKVINIDHHPKLDGEISSDISFNNEDEVSTCSLLYQIFFESYETIDKDIATALLVGIVFDSGSLRWLRSSNAYNLGIVGKLMELSDETIETAHRKIYAISANELEYYQELVSNTQVVKRADGNHFMYTYFRKDMSKGGSAAKELYMVSLLRMINECKWGFVVSYKGKNKFGISFRSTVGGPNVRNIAVKYFNGGGHALAPGGRYLAEDEHVDTDIVASRMAKILKDEPLEMFYGEEK